MVSEGLELKPAQRVYWSFMSVLGIATSIVGMQPFRWSVMREARSYVPAAKGAEWAWEVQGALPGTESVSGLDLRLMQCGLAGCAILLILSVILLVRSAWYGKLPAKEGAGLMAIGSTMVVCLLLAGVAGVAFTTNVLVTDHRRIGHPVRDDWACVQYGNGNGLFGGCPVGTVVGDAACHNGGEGSLGEIGDSDVCVCRKTFPFPPTQDYMGTVLYGFNDLTHNICPTNGSITRYDVPVCQKEEMQLPQDAQFVVIPERVCTEPALAGERTECGADYGFSVSGSCDDVEAAVGSIAGAPLTASITSTVAVWYMGLLSWNVWARMAGGKNRMSVPIFTLSMLSSFGLPFFFMLQAILALFCTCVGAFIFGILCAPCKPMVAERHRSLGTFKFYFALYKGKTGDRWSNDLYFEETTELLFTHMFIGWAGATTTTTTTTATTTTTPNNERRTMGWAKDKTGAWVRTRRRSLDDAASGNGNCGEDRYGVELSRVESGGGSGSGAGAGGEGDDNSYSIPNYPMTSNPMAGDGGSVHLDVSMGASGLPHVPGTYDDSVFPRPTAPSAAALPTALDGGHTASRARGKSF